MADFTNIMRNKTDYFSKEEIALMLNYCNDKIKDGFIGGLWLRNYALILTLYNTGRRVSEIVGQPPYTKALGLRPCDFHDEYLIEFDILKKNQIKTKMKSGQTKSDEKLARERFDKEPMRKLKPVTREYYDWMKTFIQHDAIQPYSRIFKITRQRGDAIIKDIAAGCGIARPKKKIHAHQFRHSYAIHFLKGNDRNPAALIQLKDLLEHSKIDVTAHYAQFTPHDIRESLERSHGGRNE